MLTEAGPIAGVTSLSLATVLIGQAFTSHQAEGRVCTGHPGCTLAALRGYMGNQVSRDALQTAACGRTSRPSVHSGSCNVLPTVE